MNDHEPVPVANEYAPPSMLTSTLFTPEPLSDDVPDNVTVAVLSVAPLDGEDMDTLGSMVSTVIVIDVTAELPALSVALAVMV